ncbi:MAG: DUF1285 domain-containing protein [Syntrophaceae bacterium]
MKNDIPPCEIKIDKEGVWYYKGKEIIRKEIVNFFYQNLKKDEAGRYIIELKEDCCYLDVEDTPFVVKAVYRSVTENSNEECINLLLSDQSLVNLDPSTLTVGNDNVLYCSIKNNAFIARFSRASYYQITNFMEYDSIQDKYFILINDKPFYINYLVQQEK